MSHRAAMMVNQADMYEHVAEAAWFRYVLGGWLHERRPFNGGCRMWNLEDTERLVTRMLPATVVVAALLLVWMTVRLRPERLSMTFTETAPTPLVLPRP